MLPYETQVTTIDLAMTTEVQVHGKCRDGRDGALGKPRCSLPRDRSDDGSAGWDDATAERLYTCEPRVHRWSEWSQGGIPGDATLPPAHTPMRWS